MLANDLTLKQDELFLVGSISTDGSGESGAGLYLRDTRHLSALDVKLNGVTPERLSTEIHDAAHATLISTNPSLHLSDGHTLRAHQIELSQRVALDRDLRVTFSLRSYAQGAIDLDLTVGFASDFRDLFDIRGFRRDRRGEILDPQLTSGGATLSYRGLDGQVVATQITFDRPADSLSSSPIDPPVGTARSGSGNTSGESTKAVVRHHEVLATFAVSLAPGENWEMTATVAPQPVPGTDYPSRHRATSGDQPVTTIETNDPFLNRVLDQASRDLAALVTSFPEGTISAAGIPWYVAPFGRDSLIVGLQTLHLMPDQAAATLRVLAALQGEKVDPWREEEPGKILHEMRYGEMARLNEVPHTPYFGTVDATPLFVWLFAETVAWTGDWQLYDDLLPNVGRALTWIEEYGDKDGDGLVEYRTDSTQPGHITHQVWKDSFDSLNDPAGGPVSGVIAAVEVQGYVYAALSRLASVACARGDVNWADDLSASAARIQDHVERAFWIEGERFYAQALDTGKQPVAAISSNGAQLLLTGLPSAERAARVAARLRQPDLDAGWGIRTLSANARSYNPMSYHNGSIWPHDCSLIGAGLYRYGQSSGGQAILDALLAAARGYPLHRLPELYCGFTREDERDGAPVEYPVSCSPQAWAAGAIPLLLRGMLGLQTDLEAQVLTVSPALPDWLHSVTIRDLTVFGQTGSLTVRRQGGRYQVDSDRLSVQLQDEGQERAE